MKNDQLDKLTQKAVEVFEGLPVLMLRGDGRFIGANNTVIATDKVLRDIYDARQKAAELVTDLSNVPRRRISNKEGAA